MRVATVLAERVTDLRDGADIDRVIVNYGPIPPLDGISSGNLAKRLVSDKKTIQGNVHFLLPVKIGEVTVVWGTDDRVVLESIQAVWVEDKARWVRGMFGGLRPLRPANHLLSFNLDKGWRAKTVEVSDILPAKRPVLDLCCGTGDVLLALEDRGAWTLGSDFCHPMLVEAQRKIGGSPLFEADALALPLKNNSLDLITCAFGFRNLANYEKGFEELLRVLKPGGVAAILEFSQPTNRVFGALRILFDTRAAVVGGMISSSRDVFVNCRASIAIPGARPARDAEPQIQT
jgi:demethylmenaquinone methyltransferase/2-methoxy-6-polyprenyl-1,4-benzoquinol methylase